MDETNGRKRESAHRRRLYWMSGSFVALLGALVVGGTALPSAVTAFARGPAMHDFMQWRMEKMLDRVDATAEQKQQIEEIVGRRMSALHDLHPDRGALHDSVVGVLTADEIDRDALEAIRAEQVERLVAASKLVTESLAEVAAVLDPDQRAELVRIAEEHRGGHHGRHRGH